MSCDHAEIMVFRDGTRHILCLESAAIAQGEIFMLTDLKSQYNNIIIVEYYTKFLSTKLNICTHSCICIVFYQNVFVQHI